MQTRLSSYTSFELDYNFDDEDFKTVNRLYSSFDEAIRAGRQIVDLKDNKRSITIRVRRLDHD